MHKKDGIDGKRERRKEGGRRKEKETGRQGGRQANGTHPDLSQRSAESPRPSTSLSLGFALTHKLTFPPKAQTHHSFDMQDKTRRLPPNKDNELLYFPWQQREYCGRHERRPKLRSCIYRGRLRRPRLPNTCLSRFRSREIQVVLH